MSGGERLYGLHVRCRLCESWHLPVTWLVHRANGFCSAACWKEAKRWREARLAEREQPIAPPVATPESGLLDL